MTTERRRRALAAIVFVLTAAPAAPGPAVRVGDLATLEGVRANALYGYGLVVGLQGTGDRRQTLFTNQSLRNFLERQGVTLPSRSMRVANVAGVVVTASLTAFARPGSQLDVNVASIGDATSLRGGVLLFTQLYAPDGAVYATAQGPLVVGGAFAQSASGGASAQLNHPTVARIPSGAHVERAAPTTMGNGEPLAYVLNRPDFETATRVAQAIEAKLGPGAAQAIDSRRIVVHASGGYRSDPVAIAAAVERISVVLEDRARLVVNERTGTIVAGRDIPLKPVSILHGGLTIDVRSEFDVVQPAPFSDGETVLAPRDDVELYEEPARGLQLDEGATVGDLVRALSDLGAGVTDVISVLQALYEAGALEARVEVL